MFYRKPYGAGSIFREFERLRRSVDDLLEGFPGRPPTTYPAVNVWTNQEKVMVTAELPGVKPDALDISVNGNSMTIHGKPESDETYRNYHRRERPDAEFHKTVELLCRVEDDKVEARLEKGILAIALPRSIVDKPRRITVKSA